MRILADLPDDDIRWLDAQAAAQRKSRAAVMREAITAFRSREKDWLEAGFGLWTRFGHGADGAEFEAGVRQAWLTDGDSSS
ncbi:MAG: ribbon-helix-helix protein, CopG family [Novosphingobium sp.]